MMSEIKLRECPFCGWKAKVSHRQIRFKHKSDYGARLIRFGFYGMCNKCKAKGSVIAADIYCDTYRDSNDDFKFYEKLAAEAWNRRASDEKQ